MSYLSELSFDLATLRRAYGEGTTSPEAVLDEVLARIERTMDRNAWIQVASRAQLHEQVVEAKKLKAEGKSLPLFGIPVAVKDNIDVAGMMTTVACREFAYTPEGSALVVEKLMAAGAIIIGKTNLDQFATGLTGTRSPFGICRNAFDPRFISGGSSSGSAVAVAMGMVSFALATDTAGSGRVPAAFNNIIGLKPSPGRVSCRGAVPACQSIDCISILALTVPDSLEILRIIEGFDALDPYSRPSTDEHFLAVGERFRFGVPQPEDLDFAGDDEARRLFGESVQRLEKIGGIKVEFDFAPLQKAGARLYAGAWLAERLGAQRDFRAQHPAAVLGVIQTILKKGESINAPEVWEDLHNLAVVKKDLARQWSLFDLMALPTTPTIYTVEEVEADPIGLNANLSRYTTFVNMTGCAALALPGGFRADGVPLGITLVGPTDTEAALAQVGGWYHQDIGGRLGATRTGASSVSLMVGKPSVQKNGLVRLAVVGAHLSGQPLNHQLLDRHAQLVRACRTEPVYRLFALPGTVPPKPGLVHVAEGQSGHAVEVEVWEMSAESFGSFVAAVPGPLVIGTLVLEDGEKVKGFLCEGFAVEKARDISEFGGWRAYLRSIKP